MVVTDSDDDSPEELSPVDESEPDTSDDEDFSGVSGAQTSFNITKGIVGEGMLSLPAGIGAGTGILVGIMITIVFYLLLAYTFWGLGRVCAATQEKSHKGAGDKVRGKVFGYIMAITNMVKTVATCTAYAIVIGESAEHMLETSGAEGWYATKQSAYLTVLVLVLLPLCLLRDLSKLSFSSLLGLACEMGVIVIMTIRLFDGSYQPGGHFYDTIPERYQPSWRSDDGPSFWNVSPATMVLIGSLSTAFLAHYNAPKFYHQLRRRSSKRFRAVTLAGFSAALVIYVVAMTVGYLTFGKNVAGNCLNNYSNRDSLATLARLLMLVAVTCGFPISFTGLRDATIQVFGLSSRRRVWFSLTVSLLTPISILGCTLDDLGVLNSLGGAIMGSLITIIYPGFLMYWAYRSKFRGDVTKREGRLIAPFIILFGFVMMIFGSAMVVCVKILHVKF